MEPGATKEEAVQFAYDKAAELRRSRGRALPGPMPFSELLDRYRESVLPDFVPGTRLGYEVSLSALQTFFVEGAGDPWVADIGRGAVASFLTWRRRHSPDGTVREKPLAAGSLRNERITLHGVFAFAEEFEIVETNPVTKTRTPKGDSRNAVILNSDQYEALLAPCDGRDMLSLYAVTLGESGLRCDSECLWLRWEDVDLERGFLAIESGRHGHRTKSGKSRKVPMTPRLREAMRDHMAAYRLRTYNGQRSPWVFHHDIARADARAGDRINALRPSFKLAVARAGLPEGFVQHDLRHRRVTEWLRCGHPAHKVQLAMGHANLSTTLHYAHLVEDDLLSLVEPVKEATGTDW